MRAYVFAVLRPRPACTHAAVLCLACGKLGPSRTNYSLGPQLAEHNRTIIVIVVLGLKRIKTRVVSGDGHGAGDARIWVDCRTQLAVGQHEHRAGPTVLHKRPVNQK